MAGGVRADCGETFPLARITEVAVFVHEATCSRCAGAPRGLAKNATKALDSGLYDGVTISCFNKAEADEVTALLPERIRDRVRVSWMDWPAKPATPEVP